MLKSDKTFVLAFIDYGVCVGNRISNLASLCFILLFKNLTIGMDPAS